jgi:hypothetical protein
MKWAEPYIDLTPPVPTHRVTHEEIFRKQLTEEFDLPLPIVAAERSENETFAIR